MIRNYAKRVIGEAVLNDDGFTYPCGKHKGGYKRATRNALVSRCKHRDKVRVRRELQKYQESF